MLLVQEGGLCMAGFTWLCRTARICSAAKFAQKLRNGPPHLQKYYQVTASRRHAGVRERSGNIPGLF